MTSENKNHEDIHITRWFTHWVHHHRKAAKWLMRILVAGVTALLFFIKREQKHIEDESKKS